MTWLSSVWALSPLPRAAMIRPPALPPPAKSPLSWKVEPPALTVAVVGVIDTLSRPMREPTMSTEAWKPKSSIVSPLRLPRLSRATSLPGPKWIVSAPGPPLIVSSPPPATMMSLPAPAMSLLSRSLPISVSLPVPVIRSAIAERRSPW